MSERPQHSADVTAEPSDIRRCINSKDATFPLRWTFYPAAGLDGRDGTVSSHSACPQWKKGPPLSLHLPVNPGSSADSTRTKRPIFNWGEDEWSSISPELKHDLFFEAKEC